MAAERLPGTSLPLFESRVAKGRLAYRLYACTVFAGICAVWVYRATHVPPAEGGGGGGGGRWRQAAWLGMLAADLWLGLYWAMSQSLRWTPTYYSAFRDRLGERYKDDELPSVDIFVCTADPLVEPPMLVMNTILSVLAYDYPQDKLSLYLSDDGGSEFTFYATLEAAEFCRHWVPFCKKYNVEPRSPSVYFSSNPQTNKDLLAIKSLYGEMEDRIESTIKLRRIPTEFTRNHKVFSEWISPWKSNDHPAVIKIVIDGRNPKSVDISGCQLPNLVYVAREKRPNHHHNFKAGALNTLIRISSELSNAPIILNVDCDMYSNNSQTPRDGLCFFMDENGRDVGYVQLPQNFNNVTKNNLYGDWISIVNKVEIPNMNAYGGPCYMGTGCFHRRESLCGKKCNEVSSAVTEKHECRKRDGNDSIDLEERAKNLASCTYELNNDTRWGKTKGIRYGCPVEDIGTGLTIQCNGWRAIYFDPEQEGFLGVAPNTLSQMLIQQKRWSEGMFQTFISEYCPFLRGHGKIKIPLQMAYSTYCLWGPCSICVLCYIVVPSLGLLKGIAMFPEVTSIWIVPFIYVPVVVYAQSLVEALWSGETVKGWWSMQRSWVWRRSVPHFFGFIDAILSQLGVAKSAFSITAKVVDDETSKRYLEEIMDFGPQSLMFDLLAALAFLPLLCLVGGLVDVVMGGRIAVMQYMFLQLVLCTAVVLINTPLYHGMLFRKDKGRMPTEVTVKSFCVAVAICVLNLF